MVRTRWILPLLMGCSGSQDTGNADTGICADAPLLTYANFGRGFLIEYCQGCHASTTVDRHGAPGEGDPGGAVFFDTLDEAWEQADRILARTLSETMPPSGGVADEDLVRLEWWLSCGEEGL